MLLPLGQKFGEAPSALQFSVWLGCLVALAALFKLGLGIAVDAKKLREKPAPPPAESQKVSVGNTPLLIQQADELATKTFVEERVKANSDRLVALGHLMDERHRENVGHLKEIEGKLNANYRAITDQHDALRREVRHDMREELAAADVKQENRFERQIERVSDIVRGLGRVEGRTENRGGGRNDA